MVLTGWAALSLGPWFFLISDSVTGTREYLLDGTVPLIVANM